MVRIFFIKIDFDLREKKVQTVKIIDFGFANYLSALTDLTPDCTKYIYF